ncbi:hypothetical protein OU491_002685, partial [Enterococcus hirae]|nr:hypothetical protein [Enterococcus hirae]
MEFKMNKIMELSQSRYYLIGSNSSGKTHLLKQIYRDREENTLFFDETGTYQFLKHRERVKISDSYYIYENEKVKGNREDDSLPNKEPINPESLIIIKKVAEILSKIVDKKESSGIVKLKKMLNVLLNYNLNSIENIIMDEPENFLDETNLKYIVDVLEVFGKAGIKIFIATHSARFLELSSASIQELFVCSVTYSKGNIEYELVNKSLDEVKKIYNHIKKEIKCNLIDEKKATNYADIFGKINFFDCGEKNHQKEYISSGEVLTMYLKTIIESFEFYQALLYKKVIIVEGLTEKLILQNASVNDLDYQNFYFSNGKVHIPFFIELFLGFGLNVVTMFDSDIKLNEPNGKFIGLLTGYLTEKYKINQNVKIITSEEKDLELDYEVNDILELFSKETGIKKADLT